MLFASLCMFDCVIWFFFFFKQKTAYEMRISDWSSDVCSSDLLDRLGKIELDSLAPVAERQLGEIEDRRVHDKIGHVRRSDQQTPEALREIGRASCRERVCQYV